MFYPKIRDSDIEAQIKLMFAISMSVFAITISIGILNAVNAIEFNRVWILLHVHSGTLGWLSISAIAIMLWYFTADRDLNETTKSRALLLAKLTYMILPLYVFAFYIAFSQKLYWILVIFGTAAVLVFVGSLLFAISELKNQEVKTTIHYLLIGGLLTATYGGSFGLILGLERAIGETIFPASLEDRIGVHAAAMEVGYLFLIISAIIEMQLLGENKSPIDTLGKLQLGTLWSSGFVASMGILLDSEPIITLFLPLELIGAIVITKRLLPSVLKINLKEKSSDRYLLFAFISLIIGIILFIYIIAVYFIPGNFDDPVAFRLFIATAHTIFIGAMTSAIFSMIGVFTHHLNCTDNILNAKIIFRRYGEMIPRLLN